MKTADADGGYRSGTSCGAVLTPIIVVEDDDDGRPIVLLLYAAVEAARRPRCRRSHWEGVEWRRARTNDL